MEIIPSLWLTPVKMKVCTAFGDEKGEKHLSAEPQSEGLRNVLGSLAKMPKGAGIQSDWTSLRLYRNVWLELLLDPSSVGHTEVGHNPFGGQITFSQCCLKPLENMYIYIMIILA